MPFDARAAKQLAVGDHLTLDEAPGLRLVARASGRTWIYRYKSPIDGGMKQLRLGEWPAMAFASALAEWGKQKADRDAGRCPIAERRAVKAEEKVQASEQRRRNSVAPYTVRRLVDDYAQSVVRVAKGRKVFSRGVGPIEQLLPAAVTRSIAFDLINGMRDRPVAAGNLRRELGAAWDWGHDAGRISEDVPNWWRLILRGKLPSQGKIVGGQHRGVEKRWLSAFEAGQVLRHLPHLSRLPAQLLTLYLWTGCRGAEICGMRGDEITREGDGWWWTIPKARLKTRRHALVTDLRVPLVGRALEIVRGQVDVHGDDYLFPKRRHAGDGPTDQKTVGSAVWMHMPTCKLRPEMVRARWPVEDWAPHDLRRSVRTHLAALGCSNEIGEAILGHLQPGIVGVYNRHHYDPERREWLTKLDQAWEAAAANRAG